MTGVAYGCLYGRAIALAMGVWLAASSPAGAADWTTSVRLDPSQSRRETAVGSEMIGNGSGYYITSTSAVFSTLQQDGLRYRLSGGGGRYRYTGLAGRDSALRLQRYDSQTGYANALIGYQLQVGSVTAKAFAGGQFRTHRETPNDPSVYVPLQTIAPRAVLELWFDMSPRAFASLDLGWTDGRTAPKAAQTPASRTQIVWNEGRMSATARTRLGWRLQPELALGIEGGGSADGDRAYAAKSNSSYGGVFARYEWALGELSLSSGIRTDTVNPTSEYVAFNVLFRQ